MLFKNNTFFSFRYYNLSKFIGLLPGNAAAYFDFGAFASRKCLNTLCETTIKACSFVLALLQAIVK